MAHGNPYSRNRAAPHQRQPLDDVIAPRARRRGDLRRGRGRQLGPGSGGRRGAGSHRHRRRTDPLPRRSREGRRGRLGRRSRHRHGDRGARGGAGADRGHRAGGRCVDRGARGPGSVGRAGHGAARCPGRSDVGGDHGRLDLAGPGGPDGGADDDRRPCPVGDLGGRLGDAGVRGPDRRRRVGDAAQVRPGRAAAGRGSHRRRRRSTRRWPSCPSPRHRASSENVWRRCAATTSRLPVSA